MQAGTAAAVAAAVARGQQQSSINEVRRFKQHTSINVAWLQQQNGACSA
jgi:hypothetical protein